MNWLLGKKKLKKKDKKVIEVKEENLDIEENLDLNEGELKEIVEEIRPVKKKERVKLNIPKGKALINVDKRSYLHLILGAVLVLVNMAILIVSTVGWMQVIEEKILVFMYAVPSIYVTGKFTWMMIQGKQIEDEEL